VQFFACRVALRWPFYQRASPGHGNWRNIAISLIDQRSKREIAWFQQLPLYRQFRHNSCMSRALLLRISIAALYIVSSLVVAVHAQRTWRETENETVYVGKYSNCDYGYYVTLPDGIIGHRGKAPSSNHGITVNLSNPASDSPFPEPVVRYVQVYNAYNVGEESSLREIVLAQRKAQRELHKDVSMSEPTRRSLDSLPALEFRSSFHEKGVSITERDIIAYRTKGYILYHLQLVTTPENAAQDGTVFDGIMAGFRLTKLPIGECSND